MAQTFSSPLVSMIVPPQPNNFIEGTALHTPELEADGGCVNWYALWTRSRHERVVREQLTKKGIEAFLPSVMKWGRWTRTWAWAPTSAQRKVPTLCSVRYI